MLLLIIMPGIASEAKEAATRFSNLRKAAAERNEQFKQFFNRFKLFKRGQRSSRSESVKIKHKSPSRGRSASNDDGSHLDGDAYISHIIAKRTRKKGGKKSTLRKKANKRKTKRNRGNHRSSESSEAGFQPL